MSTKLSEFKERYFAQVKLPSFSGDSLIKVYVDKVDEPSGAVHLLAIGKGSPWYGRVVISPVKLTSDVKLAKEAPADLRAWPLEAMGAFLTHEREVVELGVNHFLSSPRFSKGVETLEDSLKDYNSYKSGLVNSLVAGGLTHAKLSNALSLRKKLLEGRIFPSQKKPGRVTRRRIKRRERLQRRKKQPIRQSSPRSSYIRLKKQNRRKKVRTFLKPTGWPEHYLGFIGSLVEEFALSGMRSLHSGSSYKGWYKLKETTGTLPMVPCQHQIRGQGCSCLRAAEGRMHSWLGIATGSVKLSPNRQYLREVNPQAPAHYPKPIDWPEIYPGRTGGVFETEALRGAISPIHCQAYRDWYSMSGVQKKMLPGHQAACNCLLCAKIRYNLWWNG